MMRGESQFWCIFSTATIAARCNLTNRVLLRVE